MRDGSLLFLTDHFVNVLHSRLVLFRHTLTDIGGEILDRDALRRLEECI